MVERPEDKRVRGRLAVSRPSCVRPCVHVYPSISPVLGVDTYISAMPQYYIVHLSAYQSTDQPTDRPTNQSIKRSPHRSFRMSMCAQDLFASPRPLRLALRAGSRWPTWRPASGGPPGIRPSEARRRPGELCVHAPRGKLNQTSYATKKATMGKRKASQRVSAQTRDDERLGGDGARGGRAARGAEGRTADAGSGRRATSPDRGQRRRRRPLRGLEADAVRILGPAEEAGLRRRCGPCGAQEVKVRQAASPPAHLQTDALRLCRITVSVAPRNYVAVQGYVLFFEWCYGASG